MEINKAARLANEVLRNWIVFSGMGDKYEPKKRKAIKLNEQDETDKNTL